MLFVKIVLIIWNVLLGVFAFAQDSWIFVSAPDWHVAERELYPPLITGEVKLQTQTISDMKKWNPELLLIAGDLVSGPWVGQEWIDRFAPGGTQEEAIYACGEIAYRSLKQRFEEHGLEKIIVAVGDHEIGEDSNWVPGNEVSHLLPIYRDVFQKVWNRDDNGDFLYPETVGSVPSRPMGTTWENTSFAYKHKNVLFVTIDIWDQPDPDQPTGFLGRSISANMTNEQLQWFEKVLTEGRKNRDIKHIIVQAHCPVLSPVRGQRTGMLYVEDFEKSTFWKIMQKYQVDLYFAGEVHAPSVQKISGQFPIQVVHGAPFGRNYLAVEVSDDKLQISLRELNDGEFSTIGKMTIDKTMDNAQVIDSEMLKIIDDQQIFLHYTFDKKELLSSNIPNGEGFLSHFQTNDKHWEIPNNGQMNRYYNLNGEAKLVDGIVENSMELDGSETATCYGAGIMTGTHSFSLIAWIKTNQLDNSCIVSQGNGIRNFDIGINDGSLAVYSSTSCIQAEKGGIKLNDGEWHQVAVVVPEDSESSNDVKFYVDGVVQNKSLIGEDSPIMMRPAYRMNIGFSSSNKQLGLQNFVGVLDELSVWYKPLSGDEIKKQYELVNF